jgi:glycine cleavage system H lipoate-binding protein
MMQQLANITKYSILKGYINYDQLYYLDEEQLFEILEKQKDEYLLNSISKFQNIKLNDIPKIHLPEVKVRDLKPIVNNIRLI